MIKELRIENFAIINKLELSLAQGLVIFTGETGAGKSIILDALEAVMGGKTDATNVRSGTERAMVEAVLDIPENNREAILDLLRGEDLLDDGDILILSREMRREGRSTARINGHSVAVAILKELGEYLVDIHGQSEHLSLLNVKQHIHLLDRFARNDPALQAYQDSYHALGKIRRELSELREAEKDALRRTEMLTFQASEIEAAHVTVDEEEPLKLERNRLANAESLASLAQQALTVLDESTPESASMSDQTGKVVQALNALSRIDSGQSELAEQALLIGETVSDISRALRDYLERIEYNPQRLMQVEERLNLLHTLQHKYGGSLESVLRFGAEARIQIDAITHASERITELGEIEQKLLGETSVKAAALSATRMEAARLLGQAVEAQLADLSMTGARFSAEIARVEQADGMPVDGQTVAFDETGTDRVEFMIAPNPGEGLKPLVKIASGGETSRLMLALKNVLAQADFIPTLVFDEIDQGIGGRVGSVVGEKLWQLGREHQVFVVTHLPQLAAFGDQHFRVRKEVQGGRTMTIVDELNHSNRLDELTQMLGAVSEANATAAREALQYARERQDAFRSSQTQAGDASQH